MYSWWRWRWWWCFIDRAELLLHDALDRETAAGRVVGPTPCCIHVAVRTYSDVLRRLLCRSTSLTLLPRPPCCTTSGHSRWPGLGVRGAHCPAAADRRRPPGRHWGRWRDHRGDVVLPPTAPRVSAGRHGSLLPLHRLVVFNPPVALVGWRRRSLHEKLLPVSCPRRRRVSGSAARLRRLLAATVSRKLHSLRLVVMNLSCNVFCVCRPETLEQPWSNLPLAWNTLGCWKNVFCLAVDIAARRDHRLNCAFHNFFTYLLQTNSQHSKIHMTTRCRQVRKNGGLEQIYSILSLLYDLLSRKSPKNRSSGVSVGFNVKWKMALVLAVWWYDNLSCFVQ